VYQVKNPKKYKGNRPPFSRSSWELRFMQFCDNNPAILEWVSEAIRIPYKNPITGKNSTYVPDFFIVYVDKNSKQHAELIEVKPKSQTSLTEAKNGYDKAHAMVNAAKWKAAYAWAKQQNVKFRIVTEDMIFNTGGKRR